MGEITDATCFLSRHVKNTGIISQILLKIQATENE